MLRLPEVRPPCQDLQVWTIAQEDITPTNARTTNNGHSNVQNNQSQQQGTQFQKQCRTKSRKRWYPPPQQTTNAWTKPFVPSMRDVPVATSANRTKRSRSANQCQPISKPQTQHQQTEEEQLDDVLETMHIALTAATSLLRRISTGNTRLEPALKKIMEAAMDAINTLNVYMIMLFLLTDLIRDIHPLRAEEEQLFKNGISQFLNSDPYQGNSPSTSERSTTTIGTHGAVTHIKLVHWNAQVAITKTSAIVQDDLDIVMIQDTR